MLSKINFNKALIISFLWHIFCFFMVSVVVAPVGTGQKRLSDISFLGVILDRGSFQNEFKGLKGAGSLDQKELDKVFLLNKDAQVNEPLKIYSEKKEYFTKPYKESIGKITDIEKALPAIADERPELKTKNRYSEIEGEAKDRAVLFRPPLPDYNELISTFREDVAVPYFKVKLKLLISADGGVKNVEKIETSGYPEADLIAIRSLKKWKFEPFSPDKAQGDQEGIILLEFKP